MHGSSDLLQQPSLTDCEMMQRCLLLAEKGVTTVAPNPMVGAVLAQNGRVLTEGYHVAPGTPHAEVIALAPFNQVPEDSVLYVNLEPCSHYGKTPPCSKLLIEKGVRTVVIATGDTASHVNGRGIAELKEAGVEVRTGVMEREARFLNRRFFTSHELARPYIVLKWAETADGFIARNDGSSKWISGEDARKLSHQWRAEESAILVGGLTLIRDDPALTVRHVQGSNPLRIAIDRTLRSKGKKLRFFDGSSPSWILNASTQGDIDGVAHFTPLPDEDYLDLMMRLCIEAQKISIMVEGGTYTLETMLSRGLWDEVRVFRSKKTTFGSGMCAPKFLPPHHCKQLCSELSGDTLTTIYSPRVSELANLP